MEKVINSFEKTLREIRHGQCVTDLSQELTDLVTQIRATGKGGSLTLTINVKPSGTGSGMLIVKDTIKAKPPVLETDPSVFYADESGVLQRNDPRQKELELKTLPTPAPELKQVVNG